MKHGHRTHLSTGKIDYKQLRKINPEAARRAILEYLGSNGHNISQVALVFGINRTVVYDILRKEREGNLKDRSRTPGNQPRRTPALVEDKVIEVKCRTKYGPERLSRYLKQHEGLSIPPGTIRHIVRRNRDKIRYLPRHQVRKEKREFIDWYSARPFEIVQVDLKYIRDHKALTREQIIHLDRHDIANYQWSALDVCSRFKLIGYSREKSWTNGLCWYLWVISWLRSHGVKSTIVFTVDNGEEFGGKSWLKVRELRKLISGFACRLIQNHKGHCEENAHLERSHRTDDDEFYIPRAMLVKSDADLLDEALGYIYYYNNLREHSALDFKTPFSCLKAHLPDIDDKIRFVIPIMLDKVAVELGPWSGYHVLAQHHVLADFPIPVTTMVGCFH
jgi:transposase